MKPRKQSLVEITPNTIDKNKSPKIISNQRVNGGKYELKEGKLEFVPDRTAVELEFIIHWKEVLFSKYYRVIKSDGNRLFAECKSCGTIVNDSIVNCQNTRNHMKRHHAELYAKYKEDLRLYRLRYIELDDNEIEIKYETNYKRVLFQNYFQMLSNREDVIVVSCKICKSISNCNAICTNLFRHLRTQHPDEYSTYKKEVKQFRYEPEDVGDENAVEVEFDEEFKRIMFNGYFKIIAMTEDRVVAVCRSCKRILINKNTSFFIFRNHLMRNHPNVYKKYKTELKPIYTPRMNDIEIGTETIEHHERVLFGHYFKIVEQNGYTIIAICKNCQQVIKDGAESRTSREYFRRHLREKHADVYKKYKEEVEQLKHRQLNKDVEMEIKVEFKTHAAQTLYQEHFRIIEKTGQKLFIACNHCKSVFKSWTYDHNALRNHLRRKHAEIYKKYMTQIKSHRNLNEDKMTRANIVEEQSQPVDDEIEPVDDQTEPQSKCRRYSNVPNDEVESHASMTSEHDLITPEHADDTTFLEIDELIEESVESESDSSELDDEYEQEESNDLRKFEEEVDTVDTELEHTGVTVCLQIEAIREVSIDDESDTEEWFKGFEPEENSDWQVIEVDVVTEEDELINSSFDEVIEEHIDDETTVCFFCSGNHITNDCNVITKKDSSPENENFDNSSNNLLRSHEANSPKCLSASAEYESMESVAHNECLTTQTVVEIIRNKIYGDNISKITLNQRVNGGTFKIKRGKIVYNPDENASKLEFKTNWKNVLFSNYYRIIKKNGNKLFAECKSCKSIVNDWIEYCQKTRYHLMKHHIELYVKYKEDVRLYKLREIEPMRRKNIESEFETNFERILFQKYFNIVSRKGKKITALCKKCKSTLKCNVSYGNLQIHMKNKHPEDHSKYKQEVRQCTYEPEDVDNENAITVEFDEEFKRILFKSYFKIIAMTEDRVTAVCRECKRYLYNRDEFFSNFRYHLRQRHKDVYMKYKTEVGSRYLPPIRDNKIETPTTANHERILFKNYFEIVNQKENTVEAACKYCKYVLKDSQKSRNGLRHHLKMKHPGIFVKYNEEIAQLKQIQWNTDMEKEINVEFKTYAAQTLYREHFKIFEKIGPKLRVICNHCKSVLKGSLFNNNLQSHLKGKHAKIYKKYLKQIKCHEKKQEVESEMIQANIEEENSQSVDDEVEPQSESRRLDHTGTTISLQIDKIIEESIDDETDTDMGYSTI